MTYDHLTFRALCAELLQELEHASAWDYQQALKDQARAALAQQEAVVLTRPDCFDFAMDFLGGTEEVEVRDYVERLESTASFAALAQPEPVAPVWADIHYTWELLDAEGEWQAGGSANSLDDVRREGNRYLQTYAQDGPHKLIIQQHCVNTIEEVTND